VGGGKRGWGVLKTLASKNNKHSKRGHMADCWSSVAFHLRNRVGSIPFFCHGFLLATRWVMTDVLVPLPPESVQVKILPHME
jgi:hypothetical protein